MYKKVSYLLVLLPATHVHAQVSDPCENIVIGQVPSSYYVNRFSIERGLGFILKHPLTDNVALQVGGSLPDQQKEEQLRCGIEWYYKYHSAPYVAAHYDLEAMRQRLKQLLSDGSRLDRHSSYGGESPELLYVIIEKVKMYYDIYTAALKMVKSMPEYIDATTPE